MAPPVKYATEEEKREARIASKKRYYQRHRQEEQEKARLRWRARKQRERGDAPGSPYGSRSSASPETPELPALQPSLPSSPSSSSSDYSIASEQARHNPDQHRERRLHAPSERLALSQTPLVAPPWSTAPRAAATASRLLPPELLDSPSADAPKPVRPSSPSDRFLARRNRPPAWPTLSQSAENNPPSDAWHTGSAAAQCAVATCGTCPVWSDTCPLCARTSSLRSTQQS